MAKKIDKLLLSIIFLTLITILIILIRIPNQKCNSCPRTGYTLYPITIAIINNVQDCPYLPNVGCAFSGYIIPEDIILLIAILLIIWIYKKYKKA